MQYHRVSTLLALLCKEYPVVSQLGVAGMQHRVCSSGLPASGLLTQPTRLEAEGYNWLLTLMTGFVDDAQAGRKAFYFVHQGKFDMSSQLLAVFLRFVLQQQQQLAAVCAVPVQDSRRLGQRVNRLPVPLYMCVYANQYQPTHTGHRQTGVVC